MPMKFLVLGGSGLLGNELVRRSAPHGEVSFTYHRNPNPVEGSVSYKLDLSDEAALSSVMDKVRPDVVLHAASNPSVDWHEREKDAAYRINVLGTRLISEKCRQLGSKLVYISTAFVFPGLNRMYSEDDCPSPINFYGSTKVGAEYAVRSNPGHLIVRTDQIYGWASAGQKKSFVVNTLEKLEKNEKAEVCRDWFNSPTHAGDLADAVISLVRRGKTGVYHAVGADFLNRYDWAVKIAKIFDKDASLVVPIDSGQLNLPSKRPNARITCSKLSNEIGMKMKSVDEGLLIMKERMRI